MQLTAWPGPKRGAATGQPGPQAAPGRQAAGRQGQGSRRAVWRAHQAERCAPPAGCHRPFHAMHAPVCALSALAIACFSVCRCARSVAAAGAGPGVCDHNGFERIVNLATSIPYGITGAQIYRCRPDCAARLCRRKPAATPLADCLLEQDNRWFPSATPCVQAPGAPAGQAVGRQRRRHRPGLPGLPRSQGPVEAPGPQVRRCARCSRRASVPTSRRATHAVHARACCPAKR